MHSSLTPTTRNVCHPFRKPDTDTDGQPTQCNAWFFYVHQCTIAISAWTSWGWEGNWNSEVLYETLKLVCSWYSIFVWGNSTWLSMCWYWYQQWVCWCRNQLLITERNETRDFGIVLTEVVISLQIWCTSHKLVCYLKDMSVMLKQHTERYLFLKIHNVVRDIEEVT